MRLPVPCVYINNMVLLEGDVYDGFFSWIEYDTVAKWKELRILLISENLSNIPISIPVPITGTLSESIQELSESAAMRGGITTDVLAGEKPLLIDAASHLINLLLYLCAEEPDYSRKPRTESPKRTYVADLPPRKSAMTFVGERIGSVIRKGITQAASEQGQTDESTTNVNERDSQGNRHASPIPHIRRAH